MSGCPGLLLILQLLSLDVDGDLEEENIIYLPSIKVFISYSLQAVAFICYRKVHSPSKNVKIEIFENLFILDSFPLLLNPGVLLPFQPPHPLLLLLHLPLEHLLHVFVHPLQLVLVRHLLILNQSQRILSETRALR